MNLIKSERILESSNGMYLYSSDDVRSEKLVKRYDKNLVQFCVKHVR